MLLFAEMNGALNTQAVPRDFFIASALAVSSVNSSGLHTVTVIILPQ